MKTGKLKGFYMYEDPGAVFHACARIFIELCNEEMQRKGFFTVALSGGETPLGFYELLASEFRERVPWKDVYLFWGDERCVGPGNEESNFGAAYNALISRAGVPRENVHRMRGEIEPARAAVEYEREIRGFFLAYGQEGTPEFDLVLLGLGADGHTLSLFPGSPALAEQDRLVVDVVAPGGGRRITMTPPLVNNARAAAFLVTGPKKAAMLKEVIVPGPARYPAQAIRPASGNLIWLVDREAASGVLNKTLD